MPNNKKYFVVKVTTVDGKEFTPTIFDNIDTAIASFKNNVRLGHFASIETMK